MIIFGYLQNCISIHIHLTTGAAEIRSIMPERWSKTIVLFIPPFVLVLVFATVLSLLITWDVPLPEGLLYLSAETQEGRRRGL